MKRKVSLLLVLALLIGVMGVMVGCGNDEEVVEEDEEVVEVEETEEDEEEDDDDEAAAGDIAKLGLGVVTSQNSTDADEEEAAKGAIDTTVAAVGFDADGKVVSVSIDTIQGRVEFDEEMNLVTDIEEEVKSKKELGDDYDMRKASEIEKEWDEQMEALEDWMVGKEVDEITGMEVVEKDENHIAIPDVEELTSSVTMTVETYLEAVEKAWENAIDVEGGSEVGLGLKKDLASSYAYDEEKENAQARLTVVMSAAAFDGETVTGTLLDTVQASVLFDEEGNVIEDQLLTKKELGEEYGMLKASEIEKEWDEQIEALEEWMTGKTVDEITSMEVTERDENHIAVPDVEELTSSVTITVESELEVIENAFNNAK